MPPGGPRARASGCRRRAARRLLAALALADAVAHAADCTPPGDTSTCVDADSLWVRPAPGRLASVGASLPAQGAWAPLVRAGWVRRPITVTAPSPDPAGRELAVVSDATSLTLGAAYVPLSWLSAGATLPVVPWRAGTSVTGITSRERRELPYPVLRDPKLHVATSLARGRSERGIDATAGLDASLPLGAASSFAGAAGPAAAPWAALEVRASRLLLGAEVGARLQREVEIAGTALGPYASLAAGGGYRSPEDAYGLTAEVRSLVPFTTSERTTPAGLRVEELPVIAEALLAGWIYLDRAQTVRAVASAGRGLPLGRRAIDGNGEWFTPPTSPALRVTVGLDVRLGGPE